MEPYLVHLFKPPVDAIEGPAVCDVVDQDHALGRGVRLTLPDRSTRELGCSWRAGTRSHARHQRGDLCAYSNTGLTLICLLNAAVM